MLLARTSELEAMRIFFGQGEERSISCDFVRKSFQVSRVIAALNIRYILQKMEGSLHVNVTIMFLRTEGYFYVCFYIENPTNSERASCEACGEFFANKAALAGHKAASICGIGVGPSSNGRRMFWCRLCNYASCEKSTILR